MPPSPFVVEWAPRAAASIGPRAHRTPRALDIAMGNGRHVDTLGRAGFHIFGVDRSFDDVRAASAAARASGVSLSAWCADLCTASTARAGLRARAGHAIPAARSVSVVEACGASRRLRYVRDLHAAPAAAWPRTHVDPTIYWSRANSCPASSSSKCCSTRNARTGRAGQPGCTPSPVTPDWHQRACAASRSNASRGSVTVPGSVGPVRRIAVKVGAPGDEYVQLIRPGEVAGRRRAIVLAVVRLDCIESGIDELRNPFVHGRQPRMGETRPHRRAL